jgi:hypothetical protein
MTTVQNCRDASAPVDPQSAAGSSLYEPSLSQAAIWHPADCNTRDPELRSVRSTARR